MLFYNFRRVFAQREIENPYRFLMKHGFSHNLAHRVSQNDINRFSLEHLERICFLLRCTPHDILEWRPKKDGEAEKGHPLNALRKDIAPVNLRDYLRSLPLDKLAEAQKLIGELKRKDD